MTENVTVLKNKERPLPLARQAPPAAAFPIEALGAVLGDAAVAIHEHVQSPLAMCGQAVLAAATLVVQGHADIELAPGTVTLTDVGSSNGTTVEGRRLAHKQPIELGLGIPFLIGSVTMMVQHRSNERREPATQTSQLAALEQSAKRIAVGKLPVLVVGEAGVGKERFAERIHEMSPRRPGS